jgi:hypothetical protein
MLKFNKNYKKLKLLIKKSLKILQNSIEFKRKFLKPKEITKKFEKCKKLKSFKKF